MNAMNYAAEALDCFTNNLAIAAMLPKVIRVRRLGFSANVKRGDVIRFAGKKWNVARRSNWNLWLYEHVEMTGKTISVTIPKRYELH